METYCYFWKKRQKFEIFHWIKNLLIIFWMRLLREDYFQSEFVKLTFESMWVLFCEFSFIKSLLHFCILIWEFLDIHENSMMESISHGDWKIYNQKQFSQSVWLKGNVIDEIFSYCSIRFHTFVTKLKIIAEKNQFIGIFFQLQ